MYIYLVGKPCAGKDTVSRFISDEYGFKHLLVGKMVGEHISNIYGTDSDEMKNYYAGRIINSGIANEILKPIVAQCSMLDNVLFDGFPRTKLQLETHLNEIHPSIKKLFIMLDISDDEAIVRASKRLVCSFCSKSQIDNGQSLCKFCMSDGLYKRKDDVKESMLKRLEEFTKKTNYVFNIKNNKDLNLYVELICVNNKSIDEILKEVDLIIQKQC